MRRLSCLLGAAALCAALGVGAAAPALSGAAARPIARSPSLERPPPNLVRDELIVRFRTPLSRAEARSRVAGLGARVVRRMSARTHLARVPRGAPLEEALARALDDPRVAYAEPNVLRFPLQVVPDDPSFSQQWPLQNSGQRHGITGSGSQTAAGTQGADIAAPAAWEIQQGTGETVIAIIDSGVDVTHPDLANQLWVNPGETGLDANGTDKATNGEDDDGNGHADDVHGWDFAERDATLLEPDTSFFGHDHGTHVAGIAAAEMNNGTGIAGVCPSCKVMVLKAFDDVFIDGERVMAGDTFALTEAVDYAVAMGADIINGSYGSALWSRTERNALARASQAGVLMAYAAGNENVDNDLYADWDFDRDGEADAFSPGYPATYDIPGIVSVAATNHHDHYAYSTRCGSSSRSWPCSFTNWGHESVDLAAPGVDVLSTLPGDSYGTSDGTSMAAPHVAGAAGLVKAQNPSYTGVQVKNALLNGADILPSLTSLLALPDQPATGNFTLTSSRLNAHNALSAPPIDAFGVSDGTVRGARPILESKKGKVAWPHDVSDVYGKRLRKGRRYKVVLRGPPGRNFDLWVYKPKTVEIFQVELGCYFRFLFEACKLVKIGASGNAQEKIKFRAPRNGRFFFQVLAHPFNQGRYKLTVVRI